MKEEIAVKEKKKEEKKDNLWTKWFDKKKLDKPNKVAVLFLRNNAKATPMVVEPKDGFFSIENKTYNQDKECIYLMDKDNIPLAIIPEWSLIPYGTKAWHDKPMLEKFAELQDHTLKGIRHAEYVRMAGTGEGMKLNWKWIIGLGIVGIIGWAFLKPYLGI